MVRVHYGHTVQWRSHSKEGKDDGVIKVRNSKQVL